VTDRPPRPPRRARRASWRAADFVALDFETTGLDPRLDDVISYGLVPITEGRVDLSSAIYQEVAPRVEPRPSSIPIHHLRTQDLASAPPLREVVTRFHDALARRTILAWAAGVEIAFLRKIFGGRERTWRMRTIDVRTLILAIERERGTLNLAEPSRYSLESTATRFGVPIEQTHHALDDAFMTAELFLMAATASEARGRARVADLARVMAR